MRYMCARWLPHDGHRVRHVARAFLRLHCDFCQRRISTAFRGKRRASSRFMTYAQVRRWGRRWRLLRAGCQRQSTNCNVSLPDCVQRGKAWLICRNIDVQPVAPSVGCRVHVAQVCEDVGFLVLRFWKRRNTLPNIPADVRGSSA